MIDVKPEFAANLRHYLYVLGAIEQTENPKPVVELKAKKEDLSALLDRYMTDAFGKDEKGVRKMRQAIEDALQL